MVGQAVQEVFKEHDLTCTDIEDTDVRFWSDVAKHNHKQKWDLIIHLAAETDLEICEKDPFLAHMANLTGTANIVRLARMSNAELVYISTAGVFDGKKEYYGDDDPAKPPNHYGLSKYYGEIMARAYEKTWVFRAGWMMGGGMNLDHKFVNKIIKQIQAGKTEIPALEDVYGTPTYTWDLAETIKWAWEEGIKYDVYNCTCNGKTTRFGVAQHVVLYLGLEDKVNIIPVKTGYFKEQFPCPRSKCEALKNYKLEVLESPYQRVWNDALREYIVKEYKGKI